MPTSKDFSVEDEAYLATIAAEPKMTMDEVGADIEEHGHVPVTPETATQDPFTAKGSLSYALDEALSADTDLEKTIMTRDKNDHLDSHLTNPTDDFRDETKGEVEGTTSTPQGLIQPVESNKVGEGLEPTIQQDKAVHVKDSLAEALDAITMDGAEEIEAKPPIGKDPEPDLSKYNEEEASHIPLKAPKIPPSLGGAEDTPDANGLVYVSATFTVDPDKYVSNNYRPTNMGKAPNALDALKQKRAAMNSKPAANPEEEAALSDLGTPEAKESAASPDEPTPQQEEVAAKDADKEQKEEIEVEVKEEAASVIPTTKKDEKPAQDEAPEKVVLDYATFIDGSSFICYDEVADIDYSKIAMDAGPKKAPTRANCQTTFAQCRAQNPLFCRFHGPKLLEADIKTAIKATVGPGCVVQVTKDKNSKNKFTFRLTVGCPPSKKKMVEKMVHMYLTQNPGITSSTEDWNLVGKHKQTQEFEMDILQADKPPKKDTKADQMLSNTKKAIKDHKKQEVVGETAPGLEKKAAKGEKWETVDEDIENEWADLVDKTVHKSLLGNNEEFLANFNKIANQFDEAHDAGDANGLKQALEALKDEIGKYNENGEKKPEVATLEAEKAVEGVEEETPKGDVTEEVTSEEVTEKPTKSEETVPEDDVAVEQTPQKEESVAKSAGGKSGDIASFPMAQEAEFAEASKGHGFEELFTGFETNKDGSYTLKANPHKLSSHVENLAKALQKAGYDAKTILNNSDDLDLVIKPKAEAGTANEEAVTEGDVIDFFGAAFAKGESRQQMLDNFMELANKGTVGGKDPKGFLKPMEKMIQNRMKVSGTDHPMTKALVKAGLPLPEGMEGAESGDSEEVVLPAPPVLSKGNEGSESTTSTEASDAKKAEFTDKVKKALEGTGYEDDSNWEYQDFGGDSQEFWIANSDKGTLEAVLGDDGNVTFLVHDGSGPHDETKDAKEAIASFEKNYGGKPPVQSSGGNAISSLQNELSGLMEKMQSIGATTDADVYAMQHMCNYHMEELNAAKSSLDEIEAKIKSTSDEYSTSDPFAAAMSMSVLKDAKKKAQEAVDENIAQVQGSIKQFTDSLYSYEKATMENAKKGAADSVEQTIKNLGVFVFGGKRPPQGVDSVNDYLDYLKDELESDAEANITPDEMAEIEDQYHLEDAYKATKAASKAMDDAIEAFKDKMDEVPSQGEDYGTYQADIEQMQKAVASQAAEVMAAFGAYKSALEKCKYEADAAKKLAESKKKLEGGGASGGEGKKPVEPFDFDAWQKGQQAPSSSMTTAGTSQGDGDSNFNSTLGKVVSGILEGTYAKDLGVNAYQAQRLDDVKVKYSGKSPMSKVLAKVSNVVSPFGYEAVETSGAYNIKLVPKGRAKGGSEGMSSESTGEGKKQMTDEEKKAKIAAMSPKQKVAAAVKIFKKKLAANPNDADAKAKLAKYEAMLAKLNK